MYVRLVSTYEHGSQSKYMHQIGSSHELSNKKLCIADKVEGAEMCSTWHQGDKVALEADAFYIHILRNQILVCPFLPCSILANKHVEESLANPKELVDWQTLFTDILWATKDSSNNMIDAQLAAGTTLVA